MDISTAYKQHQHIRLMQEEKAEVEKEVKFTETAYKLAFVATFLVYFIFVWMMYVSDLWGFTTWLVQNLSEVAALLVYSVLALTLPLAMAMIKEIGYKHFAKYPNPKTTMVLIVGILAFAGVIYESISSSSQQQHISTKAAEGSKTFQAISGTNINVVGSSGEALALASQNLARCEENLKRGKEKHCEGDKAKLAALKASQQAQLKATETASTAAFEAKQKAMQELKEDAYKPVFKAIRDSFGVSISTGVMIVTLFVSVIFEISHLLLILFLGQKLQRLENLKHGLVQYQADYLQNTGKAFDTGDFAEFEGGAIPKPAQPEASQDYKQPKPGFGFIPQTAHLDGYNGGTVRNGGVVAPAPLFKYQTPAAKEPEKKQPVGFIPQRPAARPTDTAQLRKASGFRQSPEQLRRVHQLANDTDGSTYRQELRGGSKQFRDMPLDRPTPAKPSGQKPGKTGLQNPVLGTSEEHYSLPLTPPAPPVETALEKPVEEPGIPGQQTGSDTGYTRSGHSTGKPVATASINADKVLLDAINNLKNGAGNSAKQAAVDLYPEWKRRVMGGEIKPTKRPCQKFIWKETATDAGEKKAVLADETLKIWNIWVARGIQEGFIKENPEWSNGKDKYILA